MSQDCRVTVVRQSYDVHASVANMSPRNFGEFTMRKNATLVRVSYECRTIVARQSSRLSGEKIKLSDIRTSVVRHSHGCHSLATVVRMKMKPKLRSYDSRATVARQSRDIFSKLDRKSRICLIKSIQGDCDVKVLLISLIFVAK